jgi:hypothetical protein
VSRYFHIDPDVCLCTFRLFLFSQVTLDGQHYSARAEATAVLRQIRTKLPLANLMDTAFDGADRIESYSGPTFDFDGVRQVSLPSPWI